MELLLFLSALMAALTGAISGVRAPETVVHQRAGAVSGCAVQVEARVTVAPPTRSWLMLTAPVAPDYSTTFPADQLFGIAAFAPLYLSRLRR